MCKGSSIRARLFSAMFHLAPWLKLLHSSLSTAPALTAVPGPWHWVKVNNWPVSNPGCTIKSWTVCYTKSHGRTLHTMTLCILSLRLQKTPKVKRSHINRTPIIISNCFVPISKTSFYFIIQHKGHKLPIFNTAKLPVYNMQSNLNLT